jgi:hypothetical protein
MQRGELAITIPSDIACAPILPEGAIFAVRRD